MKRNIIIGFISLSLTIGLIIFFNINLFKKNNQEIIGKNRIDGKEKILRENKELEKKEKKRQEEIVKYLNKLRQIIDKNFPKGRVIEGAVSHCGSKLFRKNNKVIVPKGANVTIFNFSRLIYNRPKINRYQVLYKGKIYCIYTRKVKKKAKIIVLRGGVLETSIAVRYILFPNGKFVNIIQRAPFYPNDSAIEYIRVFGSFTRKKNTIKLCNFEYLLYPMPNFPSGGGCLKLKRNGEIWNFVEKNQRIEFRLSEY